MKLFKILALVIVGLLFVACTKQPEPVAMNMYYPDDTQESVSGITVEITQEMIDEMKQRRVHK
jgi:PBP1b-binding outer membrane lipoprotein LpoB